MVSVKNPDLVSIGANLNPILMLFEIINKGKIPNKGTREEKKK
jgi:hypothetical protein